MEKISFKKEYAGPMMVNTDFLSFYVFIIYCICICIYRYTAQIYVHIYIYIHIYIIVYIYIYTMMRDIGWISLPICW